MLCLKLAHALVLCNISTATYPLLSLLTRPVMYVFLQHALSVIFTFLHLWRGPSADDSPIGPDKVYHFSLPQHSLFASLHFPICAEGLSADVSPKGLDKVCYVRFPPTCSVRHLYICPSVQRDGQLRTVLKALTKSPIAKEVKDLLTLLEQHDAQSTCYASGSNKISQT